MRLTPIRIIHITWLVLLAHTGIQAQKPDKAYSKSWADLYKIIDSSFRNRADTGIVEQTALIQFQLTNGKIDTFYIWSTYEKNTSNWMIPFLKPAIGKYFFGYKKFRHVVVPVRISDYRVPKDNLPNDQAFIFGFAGAFKHMYKNNITIAQGLLLEPPWPAVK